MGRLDGKVALVTGAARGTGEATARRFAAEGARVAIADLRDELGEQVAKQIGDAAIYLHLDVTSEPDWRGAVERVVAHFGGLDVLVNNAGVLHLAALEETELADFERVVRVNQTGVFLGMKSVVEPLRQRGCGSIVNISSIDGLQGHNGTVAYGASKWAVRGMTRVAALELGKWGIRVNAVCPEAGGGEMIRPYLPEGVDPEVVHTWTQRHLATQRQRSNAELVDDVAKLVLFLASDESASCTGADFPVDGGNSAGTITRGAPGA
jgi:3alpha(or 20beta)-hydroxysteroid dehydrogenase